MNKHFIEEKANGHSGSCISSVRCREVLHPPEGREVQSGDINGDEAMGHELSVRWYHYLKTARHCLCTL